MNLTREQIMNEPAGRTLDAWVAEYVMEECRHDFRKSGPNVWDYRCHKCGMTDSNFSQSTLCVVGDDKSYSTDIADAWMVVEKMNGKYSFTIQRLGGYFYQDPDYAWESVFGINKNNKVLARTAPLAICRAALLTLL